MPDDQPSPLLPLSPGERARKAVDTFRHWLRQRRRGRGAPIPILLERLEVVVALQIEAAVRVAAGPGPTGEEHRVP